MLACTVEYDLKITGGLIVDGTGAPGHAGDLGIRAGRIAAVGHAPGDAARTIEARGHVVTPGFIDVHTHYDAQVLWDRMLTISPWHGVTTAVIGNCGFGIAPTRAERRGLVLRTLEKVEGMSLAALEAGLGPDWGFESFPEYLDAVERRGCAINLCALAGHTPIRLDVMGEAATERPATREEVARMRSLLDEALDAGAIGFATSRSPTHVGFGGRPVPSRAAAHEEIVALAGALREAGRGILQATIGPGLFVRELADLARETGRPVTWTALLSGVFGPGGHRPILAETAALAQEGVIVAPQVSCRPLHFDFDFVEPFLLESFPFFAPVSRSDRAGKMRVYRDPAFRRAFREATEPNADGRLAGRWERTWVSHCPVAPEIEQRSVADLARERGRDAVDLVLDLALESDLALRLRMAVVNLDEDEVAELLAAPTTVLGLSDAGAHASQLCDACFATDLLGRWVRDKGAIALPEAVRMLTSRPAELFGVSDRGRLVPGLAADVVVFDAATVAAGPLRRVRDLPAGADRLVSDASGIEAVIVNGTAVRERGRDSLDADRALPGKLLRRGRA
jgi:N-acyl-D-aspartate/D-glutamate deacylase